MTDRLEVKAQGMNWDIMFLKLFNAADAKDAEEHADAFMEQNFAEAIHIARETNWQMIRKILIEAFKTAETRGALKARAEAFEEAAKIFEDGDLWSGPAASEAIRELAKELPK